MKKFSVIITSVVLLVAFLWASTGVTVYSHYCSLSDSVNTSLFIDDADCEHHTEQATTQSCCVEKKSCSSEMNDTDCCATQKQVFRIASLFNLPDQNKKLIDIKVAVTEHILKDFEETEDFNSRIIQNTELRPPDIYGKELLIAIQQQKIAPAPIV
jgi:hypothetical protein